MQKTFVPDVTRIERKWYVIDAAGRPLGRVATAVSRLLQGKHKPEYTPFLDVGDHVIVVNADKVRLTGKKLDQKVYYRHTGWPRGLRAMSYREFLRTRPERVMEKAVRGMLPKTALGRAMMGKLRVYRGPGHPHQAQRPEAWPLD